MHVHDREQYLYCPTCGSRLKEREAHGRLRPVCPDCGWIHFQDPKVAAGVLVEREGKVLLVRRVFPPQEGKWTIPAGFIDADEDPREAAKRECFEETGLSVRITKLLDVIAGSEHERGANIMILYGAEIRGGQLEPHDDADAVGFFGPGELPPLAFKATRRAIEHWEKS